MFRVASIVTAVLAAALVFPQSAPETDKARERAVVRLSVNGAVARPLSPLAFSFTAALEGSTATYDRVFSGSVDSACNAASDDSPTGDGVPYVAIELEVTEDEVFEAVVSSAGTTVSDTVISLYCDPFDPENPAANLVAYNDDISAGNALSQFTADDGITLNAGDTYWLVVSTFAPGDFGVFQIDFDGATIVPVELQSFTIE